MAITISGENNNDRILAADGVIDQISGINIVGLITASHINVGSNIQLGNAGIVTATTFVGNVTGNVNSTSPLLLQTGGSERFRITGNNELGIAGANYGSAGQVLTSGGSGSAVTWSAIPTQVTINNNAANRIITGEGGTTLNGEAKLTFDGTGLLHLNNSTGSSDAVLKLESESGSDARLILDTSNGGGAGGHIDFQVDGTLKGGIQYVSNASASDTHDIIFRNNTNTERLRIDSSGHMGLGVTPSAWPTNNDYKGLQVGSGACIFGRGSGDEDRGGIGVNYYGTTTGAKYITNGHAARIYMADGNIYLQNAASNSSGAGVAMTLDTRLLIDTNGNIGVGDAIPPNFTGYRSLSIHGSTGGALVFGDDGTDEWETYGGDGVFKIYDRAATTTRLHLDGAYGRFGINTSSFSDTATALSLKNGRSDNDHTILDIICNDNQTCRLTFSEDSNSSKGSIRYYYTGDANYMSFYTNGGASSNERLRITSDGYVHLGNTGHGTNAVGGQAITGQDYNPRFKIYNTTASSWLMHLRNDVATNPNGIFMRAGNSSTNYSLYITGGDENKPHIIARGDQKVGIASATPYTTLDVGGSINAGSANQPYQRMFSAGGYQRATKHYFRCIKGTGTGNSRDFDIIQVDLNQNFHQAICKVFYGTRLQNVSDSQTQVNEIIFGINRFVGNNPTRSRQVIHQETNSANHADIDVVITSSSQYRVRLTFSSSCNGSSFAGGYVELIGVGSGGDGAFYSLAHSSGINY